MTQRLIHDAENEVYRIHLEGEHYAVVDYSRDGDVIHILSMRVPDELQGRGYGKVMIETLLTELESQGVKVVPVCSYAKHYLQRHKEWQHLL